MLNNSVTDAKSLSPMIKNTIAKAASILCMLLILSPAYPQSATLTWTPPTTDTLGKPIAPITGYNIFYGLSQSTLTKITIPPTSSYTVTGLSPGVNYFAMTTLAGGEESDRTGFVWRTIAGDTTPPNPPPPTVLYHVKAISFGTRPATESVLPASGVGLVLGYKLGDIGVGKPCGDAIIIKSGSTEYHPVSMDDVQLLSPTYKGRSLVAVCAK